MTRFLQAWVPLLVAGIAPIWIQARLHGDSFSPRVYLLGVTLMLACALLWRRAWTRPAAVLLCTVLAANLGLAQFCYQAYGQRFNFGFAYSILTTNYDETVQLLTQHWRSAALTLAVLALLLWVVRRAAHELPTRWLALGAAATALVFFGSWLRYELAMRGAADEYYPSIERTVSRSPMFNMRYFIQASYDQSLLDTAGRHRVTHALTRRDTGIDTYVVVVGESARRANWGLYGYARDTTPRAAAERDRMTLYTQAAAPAPLTIMAVPLTLSAATVDSYDPRLFGDNVVALAGDAGFRTYWLSNQARLGRYDTSVTAMANMAHFKTWADAPYDEALLPLLDAALAEPGRKVVFLHINGNHDNYCARYPETATVYQGGAPYEDCYDNSIRYVDALLGAVMDRLRERRASLLFYPDHGLERHESVLGTFYHGGVRPSREAFDIPMFIWNSPAAPAPARREYDAPYSTEDNYGLILDWLGVATGVDDCKHRPAAPACAGRPVRVIDAKRDVYAYADLAPHPDGRRPATPPRVGPRDQALNVR